MNISKIKNLQGKNRLYSQNILTKFCITGYHLTVNVIHSLIGTNKEPSFR